MTTWWLLSYELKKSTVLPGNQSKRHNGTINGKIPNGFPGNKTEDGPPTSIKVRQKRLLEVHSH